ncbi:transcriptional regulator [Rhodohalobacter sp.]|uniref:winged helix-turn-helix domain-containing protein n=1 Tax=Rhodohalobacter sp. TaxID=1974210 RepID=UPI002ACD6410|nr:transcriptional regulator [Rhodohalobacter sp.]MDZ7756328.1 transcriptional regulator [Rhodohalobacter sp.]
MNVSFDDLHKAFENRVRLGIMSALAVNDSLDFTSLRDFLDVTDGNLATHIKKLENEGFIEIEKAFIDNKPNTSYSITLKGEKAFKEHLKVLEQIIKSQK